MKTQKGIIHLGLILILLVFGIGALGYVMYKTNSLPKVTTSSPSPSPTPEAMMENVNTTNWKTYTNEDLSFQYPIDLDILEENSSKIAFGNSTFNSPIFEIRFSNFSKVDKNTSEEIELGYKQAVRFANSSSYVVQTTEKPLIELIYAIGDSNSKETNKQVFDKIISTFDFVEINSAREKVNYQYQVPDGWKEISFIPKKFLSTPTYIDTNDVETWLKGKMLSQYCNGPAFQNKNDENQIIVMEIVPSNGDGGFCWSIGYFMDDDKWKVSSKYAHPAGSNSLYEPEWKGDYFKMIKVANSKEYIAFAGLVNYETYELLGDEALQQLTNSFTFK